MRVAVVGLGAIGSVVAGALDRLADVVRIDRTKAPLRDGEAPVEVAVVCVKTPGTAWAAEVAARVLAPDGVAITVQNGLGNREQLVSRLGPERSVTGAIYVGAYFEEGVLRVVGTPRLELARPAAAAQRDRVEALAALLRAAGWDVSVAADVLPVLWRKVVVNAAINPVTAILDIRNGALLTHPQGAIVADTLARETARVARGLGLALGDDEAMMMWRDTARRTAGNTSSMLQDVRAGRETEIEAICGAVARNGERVGVAAPLCASLASLVGALRKG